MKPVINAGAALGARVFGAWLLFAVSAPAHAYIDPGTGSMLIQLGVASVAGALFFLRDLRHRLGAWLSRRRGSTAESSATEPGE